MKKEFFHKNKKLIISIIAAVTAAVILTTSLLLANYIPYWRKISEGAKMQKGVVPEYEWRDTDTFNLDDYPSISVGGDLKILYLTDTHLTENTSYRTALYSKGENDRAYKHIRKLIEQTSPNFIAITGDLLTDPMNDLVLRQFGEFLDSFGIPWTVTFGNHDAEWRADKETLCNILTSFDNCYFTVGPTNLQGLGNNLINFTDVNGNLFYSFIGLDSGDWQKIVDTKVNFSNIVLDKSDRRFSTTEVGITDGQAEWYKWAVEGLKAANGGNTVYSAAGFHIPLKSYRYALSLAGEGAEFLYNGSYGSIDDCDYYVTPPQFQMQDTKEQKIAAYNDYKENYRFYNYLATLGSTKDIITGHNHCGGYAIVYDGITFTSAPKTDNIYTSKDWDSGNRGGAIFTIGSDGIVKENKPIYLK